MQRVASVDTGWKKLREGEKARDGGSRGQTKEKSFEDHGGARLECKAAYRAFIIIPAPK